jgi:hypothetical protein
MTDYFSTLEPHHFRLEQTPEGPILRLHADDDGRALGVYVPVEYQTGIGPYLRLRLDADSRRELVEWFAEEDEKPF